MLHTENMCSSQISEGKLTIEFQHKALEVIEDGAILQLVDFYR